MKIVNFLAVLLFAFSSCGQAPKNNKVVINTNSIAYHSPTYTSITNEVCDCSFKNMKDNRLSTSFDSCYKLVILKYTDSLEKDGIDPNTSAGEFQLSSDIIKRLELYCTNFSKLMEKEYEERDASKLLFVGEFVSQQKLSSGRYKIEMRNTKSNETKTFFSKTPLDETQIKKYEPGYELTVEYEIIRNRTTNKDEYLLKEFGTVSSVGAVKVKTQ